MPSGAWDVSPQAAAGGKECSLPWAVTFKNAQAHDLTGVPLNIALHPAQLYESATEALLFGFLYWRYGKPHTPGQIIGLYLIISSIIRFLIEFERFHEQATQYGLSITQWIAIALAITGAIILTPKGKPLISRSV